MTTQIATATATATATRSDRAILLEAALRAGMAEGTARRASTSLLRAWLARRATQTALTSVPAAPPATSALEVTPATAPATDNQTRRAEAVAGEAARLEATGIPAKVAGIMAHDRVVGRPGEAEVVAPDGWTKRVLSIHTVLVDQDGVDRVILLGPPARAGRREVAVRDKGFGLTEAHARTLAAALGATLTVGARPPRRRGPAVAFYDKVMRAKLHCGADSIRVVGHRDPQVVADAAAKLFD